MASKTEFSPITVHDLCVVKPSFSSADEIHSPLTFLDIPWLYFTPIQRLVFYRIPHLSRSQFLETIIPDLKHSLSQALERFPILAGNVIIFSDSTMPEICYKKGDGVTLICAECTSIDFNSLVHNEDRDCADFYPLIPELRPSSDSDSTPVLALQVTLFPDRGLCIGISNNHCVGDARSIFSFMKTWAIFSSNMNSNQDADAIESQLPISVFDKNMVKDSKGIARSMVDEWRTFVARIKQIPSGTQNTNDVVRKTFVITAADVERLKKLVSGENPVRVSSFTVIFSYVWTCLIRSRLDDDNDDDDECFAFTADCRERTDPPIPEDFFGNCLVSCFASAKASELVDGSGGFGKAAGLVGRTIKQKFLHKDAVFDGVETSIRDVRNLNVEKLVTVAGSSRYNYYELDFGWGNPDKFEFISIDERGAISLSGSKDCDDSVEVGLVLSKSRMNAFTTVFNEGFQ